MTQIPEPRPSMRREINRTLILAGPLIVGQMTSYGMTLVDTIMAGRIGTVDLGAIAIGSSVWMAGFLFVLGVLMAVSATVSQLDGGGRRHQAGEFTRQALWLSLALSLALYLVARGSGWVMDLIDVEVEVASLSIDYLRAISWGAPALCAMMVLRFFSEGAGYTRPTMYIGLIGIACNIPLNYVLMFGKLGMPAMGAVGAGWATTIVFWVQLLALAGWIAWRPRYAPFALFERFSWPNWREIGALLKLGLPIGIMVFLEGGMFVGAALLIGTLGAVPIAAHQVAMNYSGLMFMVPLGLAGAITVRVGNAIGRNDPDGARRAGWVGMLLAVGFGACSAGLMLLFPDQIVALYTREPEVAALAASLLFFAAVFQLTDCLQASAAGALRGMKDTRIPMLYSIVAYWVIGLTVGWWLTFRFGWGPAGMWVGIIVGLSVAAVLLGGRFFNLTRARMQASDDSGAA